MSTSPAPGGEIIGREMSLAEIVERCERVMSHAWMVRTFIKHCEEVDDYPELIKMARSIFDMGRAVETRLDDPVGYFRMLRKKIGKFEKAVDVFREDVAQASEHMNFQQAVASIDGCAKDLREWLNRPEVDAALRAPRAPSPTAVEQKSSRLDDGPAG